ncbi:MAG TPA: ABC transporter permease, partial [Bacillota bacterium]|nr:ABC transporter permease [Bacillota bacterium]
MGAYILRRLLGLVPIILGISLLAFAVMNLAPGDFLTVLRMNPENSPETIEQMRASFGLDRPLYEQYFRWLFQLLRGNFGYSFTYRAPVSFLIKTRMFNTLLLSVTSMIVSWLFAIPIGVISAVKKYTFIDGLLTVFAFVGISAPAFFVALLLLYFIATTRFANLPIGGMTSIGFDWMTFPEKVVDLARHLVGTTRCLARSTTFSGNVIQSKPMD